MIRIEVKLEEVVMIISNVDQLKNLKDSNLRNIAMDKENPQLRRKIISVQLATSPRIQG